ncbi:MAG: TlpA family protein disulfide reductase [Deltaproteobacteria bacterium]|nr:TlpA family protein disulfide reductase [Deltaproteobacteria bacterium]
MTKTSLFRTPLTSLLALPAFAIALSLGCATGETAEPEVTEPEVTEPEVPYGPENLWWHTNESQVEGIDGTGTIDSDIGETIQNYTFVDQNGDAVELYQFMGRPILLEIGAEWCSPCQESARPQQLLWEAHEREDEFIMLSVMVQRNDYQKPQGPQDLANWITQFGITHPMLIADANLEPESLPTMIFINRDMTIARKEYGFSPAMHIGLETWFGGLPANDEICGDGIDNDANFLPDCADSACNSDAACAPQTIKASLSPCTGDSGVFDTFLVDLDSHSTIHFNTVDSATAFDGLIVYVPTPGNFSVSEMQVLPQGEAKVCEFDPPNGALCTSANMEPGVHEILVLANTDEAGNVACASANEGKYTLTIRGSADASISASLVNVSMSQLVE